MEIYSNTTRFALACNTSSKIIEPIQSRCAIVRYSKLGEKDILERLLHVCQHEKVLLVPPERCVIAAHACRHPGLLPNPALHWWVWVFGSKDNHCYRAGASHQRLHST